MIRSSFCATAVIVILGQQELAQCQQAAPATEARALLREASGLLSAGDWTLAANIAAQQQRAGDDEGATQTRTSVKAPVQLGSTSGGVAHELAVQGRLPEALKLAEAEPEGQSRRGAYLSIAGALVSVSKFDDALAVARLISKDPTQAESSLTVLLQIYAAQKKAGDTSDAAATVQEAIGLVDRVSEFPPVASHPGPAQSTPGENDLSVLDNPIPASLAYSWKPRMYESVVKALASAGDQPAARNLVARMSAMAAQAGGDEKSGILGPLALAQADVGDIATALKTVEPVKSDFFLRTYLDGVATDRALGGDIAGAVGMLPASDALALLTMSRSLSDAGNYSGARAAADKIGDPGQRAFALASLAFEQAAKDPAGAKLNVDAAWKLAQEVRAQSPSYVFQNAVTQVAAARARLGDFTGALQIIHGPDLQDRSWPLAILVQRMVGDGQEDVALTVARGEGSPRVRANALLQIATSLLDQMKQLR